MPVTRPFIAQILVLYTQIQQSKNKVNDAELYLKENLSLTIISCISG